MTHQTSRGSSRRNLVLGAVGAALAGLQGTSWAADAGFPAKPVIFIIPFPAGGSTDRLMRTIAKVAGDVIGQPLVIDARPGGSAMIAAQLLARAKPDGYTIGVLPLSIDRQRLLGKTKLELKDFTPLARVAGQTFGIVSKPGSPFNSIADVVRLAKEKPGTVTYGTSGIASTTHVGMEDFSQMAGIKLLHIPFKGGAESSTALQGGQIDLLVEAAFWVPLVEAGKMRALAVWTEQRVPQLPSTPTMKELGYDLVITSPFGIGAPAGLDPQASLKLRQALRKAILSPEFKAECDKILAPVMYQDVEEFQKFAQANYAIEKALIERINLKDKLQE